MAKDKIIEVALAMFSEKGISNTKMQEIATKAGISKKTIYKFFESKEQLTRSAYLSFMEQMNSNMNALVSSNISFVSKLAGTIKIISERLHVITPILIQDLKANSPNFTDYVEPYMKNAVFDRFRNLMREGLEVGAINSMVKLESVVLMYRDAIYGFIYMRSETDLPGGFSGGTAQHVLCESLSTIFRGILCESSLREFDIELKSIRF